MFGEIGMPVWAAAGAVLVVAVLALLLWRFRIFSRSASGSDGRSAGPNRGRVEVLETTVLDAERRLVLIRCDKIEHLVMVGGPADIVVENDVRRVRGPEAGPARSPAEPAVALLRGGEPAVPAADQRASGGSRAAAAPPRTNVPAVLAATGRPAADKGAHAAAARAEDAPQHRPARPHAPEPTIGRRQESDMAPQRRAPQMTGAPAVQHARGLPPPQGNGREPERAASLPAAHVPWPEADSIESEIVAALRSDAGERQAKGIQRRDAPPPKETTLGDLADRLEEALAQEVRATGLDRRELDLDLDAFDRELSGEEQEREPARPAEPSRSLDIRRASEAKRGPELRKPAEQKERPAQPAQKERAEPVRPAPAAPEPEAKREPPPERREEAPVISLHSRRKEAADPLEDEMARLLGELTGDTKGGR